MSEKIKQLISLFQNKPYTLGMGAGRLAKWQKCTIEEVKRAKTLSRTNGNISKVKILVLDIETAPLRGYIWQRWKQNIGLNQTISEWFMLCWSAKWLGEKEVFGDRLTGVEAIEENDKRISLSIWEILNEADIVIAHNGKRFDIPKLNTRFLLNGLPPTSPYQQIDTLEVVKKQFGFSSNKLDNILIQFNMERKLDTNFDLWKKCMAGDEESLEYLLTYNKGDVTKLEDVYFKLRPYIRKHPNLGIYIGEDVPVCGHCGSTHLVYENNVYTTVGQYPTYRCLDCTAISKGRTSSFTKNKRKILLTTLQ